MTCPYATNACRCRLSGLAPDRPEETVPVSTTEPATPLLLRVEEAAERLGIGRTLMCALVASGDVESVPLGRLRRIPAECLDEYVSRLRAAGRPDDTSAA